MSNVEQWAQFPHISVTLTGMWGLSGLVLTLDDLPSASLTIEEVEAIFGGLTGVSSGDCSTFSLMLSDVRFSASRVTEGFSLSFGDTVWLLPAAEFFDFTDFWRFAGQQPA